MSQVDGQGTVVLEDEFGNETPIPVLVSRDGVTLGTFFETKFMDMREFAEGPANRTKTVSAVVFEMQEEVQSPLVFFVGTKDNINDAPNWRGPHVVRPGKECHVRVRGRYLALRLFDVSSLDVWQLTAIEIIGNAGKGRARR